MLNQCNFIGRLGSDPESRFTTSGTQVVNLSLACSEKYKGEETTEWVKVISFGKLAEIMEKYLTKGSMVFVSGKMQTRKWQDQDGKDRYSTEIIARDMKMLGGGERSGGQGGGYQEPPVPSDPGGTGEQVPF